jgi:hypothetical protein
MTDPRIADRDPADRLCEGCGNWFAPVRKNQRYCRPSCREAVRQRRESGGLFEGEARRSEQEP